ncbi:MAG TPA: acyl-CoA desaturase [Solirubrobacteraceae bacterium]|nr:acyl-CoA desaturase [Solirubrobacteraceae bacterium]
MPITYGNLTPEDVQRLGEELDAIRHRVVSELGQEDVDYIRNIIRTQRGLEVAGRAMLEFGWLPPLWLGGTAALSVAKILDNMEIGHNVMHGQYDWTRDPALDSKAFEWDTACPADQWRHSHNFMHHTYTNILDMDRDIGYGILRMSEEQRWTPYFLGNILWATLLMLLFEYGVALHDLESDQVLTGKKRLDLTMLRQIGAKVGRQALKDYVIFPVLAGPGAPFTLAGNATANIVRNIWTFSIIFCGHFPDGVQEFTPEEAANETRGEWYLRQMLGSANITGNRLFHIMSGNLSFQIEHHLFPDIPARRYASISAEVREICERYGLPYNTGPLHRQLGSVFKKIARLSLPWVGNAPLNRRWSAQTPAAPTQPSAGTVEVEAEPELIAA